MNNITIMNATNVGYLAGLLTTSSFIPQIWKSYTIMRFNANIKNKKDRKSSGISIAFMIIIFVGMCIWIYHGILINNNSPHLRAGDALLFWNIISATFVLLIIVFTLLS